LFYTVSQAAAGTGVAHFSGTAVTPAHQSVIYEWRIQDGDANLADITSKREILRIDEDVVVHNINDITFGPDRYLYIARGDDDIPDTELLDGTTIFGSILRGTPPHSCSLTAGFLPTGLNLSGCVIAGIATAGGFTATFAVEVMDTTGDTATRELKLKSNSPGCYSCQTGSNL